MQVSVGITASAWGTPQFLQEISRQNLGFEVKQTWIQILALPFTCTVTLGKRLDLLSELPPQ